MYVSSKWFLALVKPWQENAPCSGGLCAALLLAVTASLQQGPSACSVPPGVTAARGRGDHVALYETPAFDTVSVRHGCWADVLLPGYVLVTSLKQQHSPLV